MAATRENLILNSPYERPKRHFRVDEDGITSEIAEGAPAQCVLHATRAPAELSRVSSDSAS